MTEEPGVHPLKTEMELKWPAVDEENGSLAGATTTWGGRSHKLLFLSTIQSSVKNCQAEFVKLS